jgi:hypothetical protein
VLNHRQLGDQHLNIFQEQVGRFPAAQQQDVRVISAVTFGLPSRSPPIQEVKRTGTKSTGRR